MLAIVVAPARAATRSDSAVYSAVVKYFTDPLHSIPCVRAFVIAPTLRVTRRRIENLAAGWQHETFEWQSYDRIRRHVAYGEMFEQSRTASAVAPIRGAIVVTREPRKLNCEGANGEISRDIAIRLGTPGYLAGDAVVFATMHECFSASEALFLLKRDGDRWQVVEVADLGGWGE